MRGKLTEKSYKTLNVFITDMGPHGPPWEGEIERSAKNNVATYSRKGEVQNRAEVLK